MTRSGEHYGRHGHTPAGVPELVYVRPCHQETSSRHDRAAIVSGFALDRDVAAGRHRPGEWREGPLVSWWRTRLGYPPAGRHRETT